MRVVLAEDSVLLREGLARLLAETGFEVVGQCATAEDLLLKVRSYSPEVVIVDIRLPPTHTDEGLRAAQEIRVRNPSVGVLVLSQYLELGLAMKLLARAGVAADALRRLIDLTRQAGTVDTAALKAGFSPRTQQILDHAREVAADISGESTIASDHLLLSLLRRDEAIRQMLVDIGLSLNRLEAEMRTAQTPSAGWSASA